MRVLFISIIVLLTSLSCKPKEEKQIDIPKKNIEFDAIHGNLTDFKTITFPSTDGLTITADLYLVKEPKEFILLCHQARFSRGEYIETAKKLNKMGYSCIAIDQRSGKTANNVINETAKLAKEKDIKVKSYLEAKPDIVAAISYTYELNNSKPIIIVGSSYSASLSLVLSTNNNKIKAVAVFSPGEYIEGLNVTDSIADLDKPLFVTSSKKEIEQVAGIISKVKSTKINHFKPKNTGIHGSRVLWKKTIGNENYWKAFTDFLSTI